MSQRIVSEFKYVPADIPVVSSIDSSVAISEDDVKLVPIWAPCQVNGQWRWYYTMVPKIVSDYIQNLKVQTRKHQDETGRLIELNI